MEPNCMSHTQWLERLMAFDQTRRQSNLDLIHCCRDYLEELGVKCTLAYNAEKTKASLWATLPGNGGVTDGGIILSGHADVVSVDGEQLDSDPLTPTERDGTLSGGGAACDMKGFIAVCMSLTPELLRMKRAKPIHLAWACNEVVGSLGAKVLAEYLRDHDSMAEGCIVGEPTRMAMAMGQRDVSIWRIRVRGKAVHTMTAPEDDDYIAIDYAARLIMRIREVAEELRARGTRDDSSLVPFTTISTNPVEGRDATNTLSAGCEFAFEFRTLPLSEMLVLRFRVQACVEDELLPELLRERPDGQIEVDFGDSLPAWAPCMQPLRRDAGGVACAVDGDVVTRCGGGEMRVETMSRLRLHLLREIFATAGEGRAHL